MVRYLGIPLLAVLMHSPILYAQTISVSVTDWQALRTEYLLCKSLLTILSEEVSNLERSLKQAKQSQENSGQKIVALEESLNEANASQEISERKISDLETRLAQVKAQRDQFQTRIESLEHQLTALGTSLTDTQTLLNESESTHIAKINALAAGYERRLITGKLVLGVAIAIALGEAVYILIDALTK